MKGASVHRLMARFPEAEKRNLNRVRTMHDAGTVSEGEVRAASIAVAQAEGTLARVEADLRYAIGTGGSAEVDPAAMRDSAGHSTIIVPAAAALNPARVPERRGAERPHGARRERP